MVCVDCFEILHFMLVDYTELIGLQKDMKAMISVPVTIHVKTNISSCIFVYIDTLMVCMIIYVYILNM